MSLSPGDESHYTLENEIADLEARLCEAKQRLASRCTTSAPRQDTLLPRLQPSLNQSSQHYLLLLSDSALPLGSFAFSSGLESYLAHTRGTSAFSSFLPLSLYSYASTTLPFLLAAHRRPSAMAELDDCLDATIICTVGRRASVAQGRALLSIWEKSYAGDASDEAEQVLRPFAALLRSKGPGSALEDIPLVSGHLAPLFGAIASLTGLTLHQTAYVFMLSHVRAVVSAAVRLGVFGMYQAQKILASGEVQGMISAMVEREWETSVEEAGQSVPVMDLWFGRHELLYSRIFNS
jgi:urease accessory protein